MIQVLLADNHPIVRAGIRAQLERIANVEVVGEANDGREAVELAQKLKPAIVFMDITMPVLNGLEATERLMRTNPAIRVIILSRHETEEYFWGALKRGASGYLLKRAAVAELEAAVERVSKGEIYLSRDISNQLIKKFPLQQAALAKSPLEQLTDRQREI
ncbi:MAG TPA: response regulator transcription factor, partial [Verrucomicrobiae bacterium]|nr:response regulator transcription factor [Verrucomicrobiae bacterium]